MKLTKLMPTRLAATAALMLVAAVAGAEGSNKIVAKYGTAPSSSDKFTIKLINAGDESTIAGFAFKVKYDPNQVSLDGVANNTGQSAAQVQYTLGKEQQAGDGLVQRVLTCTTIKNLTNADNLAELKLSKKAGFTAPLRFSVEDRSTAPVVDGLQNGDLKNVPHSFDVTELNQ